MYCFVLHIGINLYWTNSKETYKSCVRFQHVRPNTVPDQVKYLVAFCMLKANTGLVRFFATCICEITVATKVLSLVIRESKMYICTSDKAGVLPTINMTRINVGLALSEKKLICAIG